MYILFYLKVLVKIFLSILFLIMLYYQIFKIRTVIIIVGGDGGTVIICAGGDPHFPTS